MPGPGNTPYLRGRATARQPRTCSRNSLRSLPARAGARAALPRAAPARPVATVPGPKDPMPAGPHPPPPQPRAR